MDCNLQMVKLDTLRPLVRHFLDQLTTVQWSMLESGSVDTDIAEIITSMCVDIVKVISAHIYALFKQRQAKSDLGVTQTLGADGSQEDSSGSEGSQKSLITEDQVRECLGDIIELTFAEVTGVSDGISCPSTEKMTQIVSKEVTERINSELCRCGSSAGSSEGNEPQVSRSFTRRLKTIVKHVAKILKSCAAKVKRSSRVKKGRRTSKRESDEAKKMLEKSADFELNEGRTLQIGILPFEEDKPENSLPEMTCSSSPHNDMKSHEMEADETTEILEKSAGRDLELDEGQSLQTPIIPFEEDKPENSLPEMTCTSSLKSHEMEADKSTEVLEESADQDTKLIWESWQTSELPVEDPQSLEIKDYTTEAVKKILQDEADAISPIDLNSEGSQDKHDLLVSCAHQDADTTASEIARDIVEQLRLETGKSTKMSCWRRVGQKLKAFFVNRFAKASILNLVERLRRNCSCFPPAEKESVEVLIDGVGQVVADMIQHQEMDIERFIECIYERLARGISTGQLEMATVQLTKLVFQHLRQGRELKFRVKIKAEVDTFMKQMWNWLNQQVRLRKTKRDHMSVALKKIKGLVVSVPTLGLHSAPISVTEPVIGKEAGETLTLVFEAAPPSITDEPASSEKVSKPAGKAIAHGLHEWDETSSGLLVIQLLNQITKRKQIDVPVAKTAFSSLKQMLWADLADSAVAIKPKSQNINNIAKAVYKDLCQKMGDADGVRLSLILDDDFLYKIITETLKSHLMTPQKTGVKRFFTGLFKTMASPFNACCRCGCKK